MKMKRPLTTALAAMTAMVLLMCNAQEVQFAAPKDAAEGTVSGIQALDVGDINGDGRADVAVVSGGMHGSGATFAWFEAPSTIQGTWKRHEFNTNNPLRAFLGSCKLADFDNDGDLDLAVSSDNHSGTSKQADVYVFLNPGGSNAANTWPYYRVTSSTQPWHHINDMDVDDMDGDGKMDIVCRSLEPNTIHIFFNNSVSSWTRKSINTGLSESEGLAVGKLSGSLPDIEFTGYWLKAPSNPRTQSYAKLRIDANYYKTNQNTKEAIGDIDGDGRNDVVIAPAESYRDGGDYYLAWYRNPGNTNDTDWPKTIIVNSTNRMHQVKLGDIDGDGDLDLITGQPWSPKAVKVFYNDGNGNFGTSQTLVTDKGLYSSAVIDVDGDGDLDIVGNDIYSSTSKPWVYENLRSNNGNTAPNASFTLSVNGKTISVDASGSSDSDGDALTYSWTFGDGNTSTGETASHTYAADGTYIVTLTVSDGELQGSTTRTVVLLDPTDAFSRIEAEDFLSSQGIGIYDGGSGKKVGSIENGTWISFKVDFDTGAGGVGARVSSDKSGGTIEFRLGSTTGTLIGSVDVPGTGDWNNFIDVTGNVSGATGVQDLYLVFTGGSGSLLDIDYLQFSRTAGNQAPTASFTLGASDKVISVDASSSSDPDGNTLTYSWDFGDGNTGSGQTASHTYATDGTYTVTLTVSDGQAQDTATRSVSITSAAFIDAFARIEAESFLSSQGIGIYTGGSGQKVGSIENGTWISFKVNFDTGAASVDARVSSSTSGGTIEFRLGSTGGTLIGTAAVPGTGGWNSFIDVTGNISGATGNQDLFLVFTGGSGALLDVDYFQFSRSAANQAPSASFAISSSDKVINVDAAGSSDPDGDALTYSWDFGDGNTGNGETASHTFAADGTYTVKLTVSDGQAQDTATRSVAISSAAFVDAFSRIEAENFIASQGIGIYDGGTGRKVGSIENGTWINFKVNFSTGAASVQASVSSRTSGGTIEFRLGSTTGTLIGSIVVPGTGDWNSFIDKTTTISGASGEQDLYLVFTGGSGALLDVDHFQFSRPTNNEAPEIESSPWAAPETITLPETSDLAVTASDLDGDELTYNWTVVNGPGAVTFSPNGDALSDTTTATFATAGSYTIEVAVSDGTATVTDQVAVTVVGSANAAPTVSLTAPADGTSYDLGATVALAADAADSDGNIAKVEFFAGATKLGEDNTSPYTFTWDGAIVGSHALTAKATDDDGASAISTAVIINVTNTTGTWQNGDIGAVAASGSVSESNGVLTVRGSGADIWGKNDEFHFVHATMQGDGEIMARVDSMTNPNEWAKAGLMIRETLDPDSKQANVVIHALRGTSLDYRLATGGDTSKKYPNDGIQAPYWTKLVRTGNTFTGYKSADGSNWTKVGEVTISMATNVYVGMAVTAHNDGAICEVKYSNVTVTP